MARTAEHVIAGARREFIASARAAAGAIGRVGAVLEAAPADTAALDELRHLLHKLNGTAGTFGFAPVGRMAAALESATKRWIADPALDPGRRGLIASRFARTLTLEMDAASGADAAAIPPRRLLLIGFRDAEAVPLTVEASARGFAVERVSKDDLPDLLDDGVPFASIATDDVVLPAALMQVPCVILGPLDDTGVGGPAVIRRAPGAPPATLLDAIMPETGDPRATLGVAVIVDDDPVMRSLVALACKEAHLRVVETQDAEGFFAALGAHAPRAIIVDLNLGGSSGLDIVRLVADARVAGRPAILVLSGHADDDTRRAALAAGADEYLTKPVDLGALATTVARLAIGTIA